MNNEENNLPIIGEQEPIKPAKAKLDPREVERSRKIVLDYIGAKTLKHENTRALEHENTLQLRLGQVKTRKSRCSRREFGIPTKSSGHENTRTQEHESASTPVLFDSGRGGLEVKNIKSDKKIFSFGLNRIKTFLSQPSTEKKNKPKEKEEKPKPTEKILKSVEEKKKEDAIFLKNIEQEIETVLEEKLETAAGSSLKVVEEKVKLVKPLRIGFRELAVQRSATIIIKLVIFIICFLAVFVCAFYVIALPLFGR